MKVDQQNRVVIPTYIRKMLGIKAGDTLNIELVDGKLIIKGAKN